MLLDEEVRTFPEVMVPVFDVLLGRVKDLELCQTLLYAYLDILLYFTRQKDMAKVGLNTLYSPGADILMLDASCPEGTRTLPIESQMWCHMPGILAFGK